MLITRDSPKNIFFIDSRYVFLILGFLNLVQSIPSSLNTMLFNEAYLFFLSIVLILLFIILVNYPVKTTHFVETIFFVKVLIMDINAYNRAGCHKILRHFIFFFVEFIVRSFSPVFEEFILFKLL